MSTSLTIPNSGMRPIGQRGGSVTVMNPMYAAQGGSVTIMQNVQAAPQYQCINPGNVSLAAACLCPAALTNRTTDTAAAFFLLSSS